MTDYLLAWTAVGAVAQKAAAAAVAWVSVVVAVAEMGAAALEHFVYSGLD